MRTLSEVKVFFVSVYHLFIYFLKKEKTFLEKTQNSYDFSKTNIVNLQKYQKIFNESNLYQDFSTSSYVPKSLLTKTHFKNIKKTPFNSVTHINPFEKIVHDLTDHEILMKTQITKNLLTDDHQKTREKIKKNNDISFIYEGKETNRTIAKEISIIKDGLEVASLLKYIF